MNRSLHLTLFANFIALVGLSLALVLPSLQHADPPPPPNSFVYSGSSHAFIALALSLVVLIQLGIFLRTPRKSQRLVSLGIFIGVLAVGVLR